MSVSCPESGKGPAFCLLWTVGFSGKRVFEADETMVVAPAIKKAVDFLCMEATKQDAQLTAVSSLARGGDVLFAETVLQENACAKVQWKCLLPFEWDAFIKRDLAGLPSDQEKHRRVRAKACLEASVPAAEVVSRNVDPGDQQQRHEAYLDCGYRTVDEADVMIFLLKKEEIQQLKSQQEKLANEPEMSPNQSQIETPADPPANKEEQKANHVGTLAIASYALAALRPMIVLPVDAPDPWADHIVFNDPSRMKPPTSWFVDPMVTDVVRRAKTELPLGPGAPPSRNLTDCRRRVWEMQRLLGQRANWLQRKTLMKFRWILRFHLAATAVAALMATVLALDNPPAIFGALVLVFLAFLKPGCAGSALALDRNLHHRGDRQDWIHARVLAELCRGAVATWPLPIQPLDASDEEDFPKVKRLIRSLRLLREQDLAASVRGAKRFSNEETQHEADMREACDEYIEQRLEDQAGHYEDKHRQAKAQAKGWRWGFIAATWVAILAGLTLAVNKIPWAFGGSHLRPTIEHWFEAFVIVAPFVAAHCLGMMTILDCRRRENRYEEMRHYLTRIGETLKKTQSNSSRVRLIEQAERMMIEEQHEWFSVMRNLSV